MFQILMGYLRYTVYSLLGVSTFAGGTKLGDYLNEQKQGGWDSNWDGRASQQQSKATRYLFLIRHGNYSTDAADRNEKKLTELGIKQLHETGKYLKSLGSNYSKVTESSLVRAIESCAIVSEYLPANIEKTRNDDLCEGFPWVPIPYRTDVAHAIDYERIERAFKNYFYRAPPDQKQDSYEVIVCHANVIRYFVCRVLQIPPSAWLRMSLFHGSVTQILIRPSGNVTVLSVGDIGFMPNELRTR